MNDDSTRPQSDEEVPPTNPRHVAWLDQGVESWNRRREEEPFDPVLTGIVVLGDRAIERALIGLGTLLSQSDLSGVNLSGADLRQSRFGSCVFRGADLTGANLTGVPSLRSDFGNADLRGAKLSGFESVIAKFQGARFGNTRISGDAVRGPLDLTSDFNGTHFLYSDLTGADFSDANLSGASFRGSDLSRANLVDADLTGVNLVGSRLWRARLFEEPSLETGPPHSKTFEFEGVGSLRDLQGLRQHLRDVYANDYVSGRVRFYFRGEPCSQSSLRPTVMRRGLKRFERDLLTGLKTEFPTAFSGCEYAIDELAIARHFELPSRLLDVTRNPLVGVYWATDAAEGQHRGFGCEEIECKRDCSCVHPGESCEGKLHVFAIPSDSVRTYDSDRVSIVANFARLPALQRERLLTKRQDDVDFRSLGESKSDYELPRNSMNESKTTLLHNIQREKPYFTDDIDMRDLFGVFVVEPRLSFDRIRAQSGAFMLSAFHERFEGVEVAKNGPGTMLYDHHVIPVPAEKKDEIRDELDWIGVNKQTLYADVESTVEAVTNRFRKLAAMTQHADEEGRV